MQQQTIKYLSCLTEYYILLLIGFLFSAIYLQITSHSWYEDDPNIFYYANTIKNPFSIFLDRSVLQHFTTGKALVPMQLLSVWGDVKFFGFQPLAAYLHSLVSFLVALCFMYSVLVEWTKQKAISFGGCVLWMLLPSTISIHEFNSARHYMEGLVFFLSVVWLLLRHRESSNDYWSITCLIVLLSLCSMLSKEIYATTVPTLLMLAGIFRRNYRWMGLALALIVLYALYRFWIIGSGLDYTMPLVGMADYILLLQRFPYMLTASNLGYFVYFGIAILTIAVVRREQTARKTLLLAISLGGAALVALYPVTYALLLSYDNPGTWYRAPFLINTMVVMWLVYIISYFKSNFVQLISIVLIGLMVLPGTRQAQHQWLQRKLSSDREADFYLGNPDKLVYSEVDAPWFLEGISRMYAVSPWHYLHVSTQDSDLSAQMLSTHSTIWRYQSGQYVADDLLYQRLVQSNKQPR